MMNQNRLALLLVGVVLVALVILNLLAVRYEVAKSDQRITQAIATEGAKLRAWELSQSQKTRSASEHSHCFTSGSGQWPEEATTNDCTEEIVPNPTP
jgi:hypothetical protein